MKASLLHQACVEQGGLMRGGSSATNGQQQALAILDRIVTGQATVLSFEHAFEVIALFFLGALALMPFLPGKVRAATGAAISIDH